MCVLTVLLYSLKSTTLYKRTLATGCSTFSNLLYYHILSSLLHCTGIFLLLAVTNSAPYCIICSRLLTVSLYSPESTTLYRHILATDFITSYVLYHHTTHLLYSQSHLGCHFRKLKARTSLLPRCDGKRHSSFEL